MAFDFKTFGETEETKLTPVSSGFDFSSFGDQVATVPEVVEPTRSDGAFADPTKRQEKVADFFGIKKFGEGIGKALFSFTKEKKNLDRLLAEGKIDPKTYEEITTGGLTSREVVGSAINTAATFIPGAKAGSSLVAKVGTGAAIGYAFDIGSKLQDKQKTVNEALTPGTGTVVGAVLPVVGRITGLSSPGKTAEAGAKKLEEINLRLTPTDKQNLARKGDDVVGYLARKKIVGGPEQRYLKVNNLYNKMENRVNEVVKGSGATFSRDQLIKEIQQIPELYIDDLAEYPKVSKTVERAIKTLQTKFPDQIPAERINALKRAAWKSAYSKNNSQVINSALHDIGDVFKSNLDQAVDGLQKLNNEYGILITARKLLFKAQSRNQIGLVGKGISSGAGVIAGTAIAGPAGATTGAIIGPKIGELFAGTASRSLVGAGLQKISEAINRIPTNKAGKLEITKKALIRLFQG